MSPRQILILFALGLPLAGCSPAHRLHDPFTQMDNSLKAYTENPSDYIDGEVVADAEPQMEPLGTIDEMALIRQAQGAQTFNDDEIVQQAMVADEAISRFNMRAPLHRMSHTPDVVMHEVRQHQPYLLDSGDRVRVFIYGQPNLSRTYNVDGGGFISVPLIGTVRARNITTHQLEISIGNLLATQYVKNPQVSVEISQHRPFFILGEVRRAGQYPFVNGMTAQTAVAIAGGYSDRAHEKSVKLTRKVNGYRTIIKVAPHEPIYPGDTINVRERFF